MKNYKTYLFLLLIPLINGKLDAQSINWASLKAEDKHIVNANFGAEYGVIFGVGYGYHIKTDLFDIVPNFEFSFPSGNRLFDDFKTKPGVQIRWNEFSNFQISTKIQGIFRRYENDFVRMVNFGSDLSAAIGYYRAQWCVSGEFGFDKAILTNFKHSQQYKSRYPGVVDGWYEPTTGGNFHFGLQVGYSFKKQGIFLKGGKIIQQDFKTNPLLPFYAQLAYNIKFE